MSKKFPQTQNQRDLVGLRAGLMSLGTFLSRILGFLRDLCIAAFFSKTETDVFFVAFRFPNFFRRLFGEGSFSASVTPVLTESLQADGEKKTKELSACLFTLLFCAVSVLTLLGALFMEGIVYLFFADSAYSAVEGKLEKTVIVGRLVFTYLFFVSLYSYFMSAAQALGRFFIPALAPAFFNLSLIAFAWTPQSWWPFPSVSLAWAVIVGGALQLAVVLYEMRRLNFPIRFSLDLKNPFLAQAGKRFLSGTIGLSAASLIGLINVYFSGWLEEGAPSYIYYGDRLLEFPRALIAISIGTALIPELTRQYALKKYSDFNHTAGYYLRFSLFLTLPCSLALLMAAQPMVELLFMRGEFDSQSAGQTAEVVRIYSAVLIFSSLSRVLSSCFFAINKNWHIALSAVLFVCFHALCAGILTSAYGLKGLAGATALSSAVYFALLAGFLSYLTEGLRFKPMGAVLLKSLPGLALMALCLMAISPLVGFFALFMSAFWALFFAFPLALFSGGGLYILSGFWLKEEMAVEFLNFFKRRAYL